MTVRQAADKLEVSTTLIYQVFASGKPRCYRVGNGRGVIRIDESHVKAFLRESQQEPRPLPAPSPSPSKTPQLKHITIR